jgi:metal-dependent amidase/aminoacylase/carboxypeptidase family protein
MRNQMPKLSRRTLLRGATAGLTAAGLTTAGPAPAWSAARSTDRRAIDAVASRLDRNLIALRRDLHRHPELPGRETRTAGVVAQRLRAAGLDVRTGIGGHGVVGVLHGTRPGRTIAYRADMDAVPPSDQINGGPTVAHVCGHDLHTAIGVGIAEVLACLRHRLSGRLMFVFQPAEEALTGAAAMLADGLFTRTRPTEIHALHCGPFPVGQFVVTPGVGLPGQDQGTITLTGPDAAARAARLADDIVALGTVTPPAGPAGLEQLVADILTPDGPLTEFVYLRAQASGATVRLASRCWPENRYPAVRADIRRLAGAAEVSFPAEPTAAMIGPEPTAHALRRHLTRTGADVATLRASIPFNGEDYALFLKQMPGTFTFLGVRAPRASIETSYPHFGKFTPDERAIGHGVRVMADWLTTRT